MIKIMSTISIPRESSLIYKTLQENTQNLIDTIGRLSSGKHIIKAKDDQANFAISDRINREIRESNRRALDLNDSISMSQVAHSGIDEIIENIQRMKEIAITSANENYTSNDRINMQSEIDEHIKEIKRIANDIEFNGTKLLDGTKRTSEIDTGKTSIEMNLLSFSTTPATITPDGNLAELDFTEINDKKLTRDLIEGLDWLDITETAGHSFNEVNAGYKDYITSHQFFIATYNQFLSMTNNAGGSNQSTWKSYDYDPAVNLNLKMGSTTSNLNQSSARGITSTQTFGDYNMTAHIIAKHSDQTGLIGGTPNFITKSSSIWNSGVWLARSSSLWEDPALILSDVFDVSVLTQDSANSAISVLDTGLESASRVQNTIGTAINRLESVIKNYEISETTMKDVYSRIVDVDIPKETVKMVFQQIIQKASVALTAQKNLDSKIVHDILFHNM